MDVVDAAAAATEEQATDSQSKPILPNRPGIGGGCSSTSVAWTLKKGGRELTDFGSVGDSAAAPAQSDGREQGREGEGESRAKQSEGGRESGANDDNLLVCTCRRSVLFCDQIISPEINLYSNLFNSLN